MASLIDYLPLAFFIISTSLLQIQARENLFFSKAIRYEAPEESTTIPEAVYVEPERFYPQSGNGYGLYGRSPDQLVPRTTPNYFYSGGGNGHSPRFPEEFRPEIFENNNNAARYESRRTPFQTVNAASSSRIMEGGEHRYDTRVEGYYDGYERGTTYAYDSGREGYLSNQQNQEKQEGYIP